MVKHGLFGSSNKITIKTKKKEKKSKLTIKQKSIKHFHEKKNTKCTQAKIESGQYFVPGVVID